MLSTNLSIDEMDTSLMDLFGEARGEVEPVRALLIVDMQNDFLPGGALAVPGGDEIIAGINALAESGRFVTVVATQDWHPRNHCSFVANGGTWPDHCVQGTHGAELVEGLTPAIRTIFRKGFDAKIEAYSGFLDSDGYDLGLLAYLDEMGVDELWIVGLAFDFCVQAHALDAKNKFGFDVVILKALTRSVFPEGDARIIATLVDDDIEVI